MRREEYYCFFCIFLISNVFFLTFARTEVVRFTGVGSFLVAVLSSCQDMKAIAL